MKAVIYRNRKHASLILLLILLLIEITHAQEEVKDYNYFMYPGCLSAGNYKHSVIVYAAKLPEDMVEEATNWIFAPVFTYSAKYGISKPFILTGSFNSNIITYNFSLGTQWINKWDNFSISLGYSVSHFFGSLNDFGFKSNIYGWLSHPNVTIGYQFAECALAIRAEGLILISFTETIDEIEVPHYIGDYDGIALGLYIEQPLWKKNVVILGMKFTVSKFYYPAWMVFTRFDRHLLIAETVLGFNL